MSVNHRGESFSPTVFAEQVRLSRATIYRYIDDGLLELVNSNGRQQLTSSNIQIAILIQRLRGETFRFRISDLTDKIWPEFSFAELVEMAELTDEELWDMLGPKGTGKPR